MVGMEKPNEMGKQYQANQILRFVSSYFTLSI